MASAVKSMPLREGCPNIPQGERMNADVARECVKEFCTKVTDHSKDLPKIVEKYRGLKIELNEPKGYAVRISDLGGTVYWGRDEMLESWNELYLPKPTKMVVIGAIDNFPSLAEGLQLIVMVDSQGKVYFYENEVLHLTAHKLENFFKERRPFPPIDSYEYGQCITSQTERKYLSHAKIDKSTEDFVQKKDKDVEKLLDFFRRSSTLSK